MQLAGGRVDGLCPNCLLRGLDEPATIRDDETLVKDAPKSDEPSMHDETIAPSATEGAARSESSAPVNRTVGDYELLEEIARGGMGVVYRAKQKSLNREVALKMILSGSLASEEDRIRFQTEAEAAAGLDHPGIVPIYEVGHQESPEGIQYFYSMALIEGTSLADRLQEPVDETDAAELMLEICDAVEYAHKNGIIHRDLKPANILLDHSGRPRITDFGLAKNVDGDSQLTATGQVMGTPSYMPPEQVSGTVELIGPASDVYALGAILYCMLTGRPPFQSDSLLETLTQVLDREPEPVSLFNNRVDINLETICLKCLEKKPENRFKSVQDFADELSRFLKDEPIQSRRISTWERIKRWKQMVDRNPDVRIQSKTRWFGIPLVSIAFGKDRDKGEETGTAKGIFAFGDKAFGVFAYGRLAYGVFAYGKHARGGVTIGLTSIGAFSAGFLSAGLFSCGAFCLGYVGIGCVSLAYQAIGLVTIGHGVFGAFRYKIF